ncbi:MAG: RNA polymerase sigma factor [Pirellulaceae bacterium]|jgi:RNA polymerase sigma-70 factor (ECF subfamily)|nr:RNA polymerase sigma factor [Pirellulaceae bacterium]
MRNDTSSQADVSRARGVVIDWQAALASHDRWLRTVVATRLREPEAVDEVMQEVALAAVRQAAPLSDPGKVAPWLYRLAVRQSLLFRRKCGRQRRLTNRYAERLPAEDQWPTAPNPLDWLLRAERCQLVRDALERLAPRDAQILLLKYGEGWNYHRIAAHLGVSHSAVETRLHRARQRLRMALAVGEYLEVG